MSGPRRLYSKAEIRILAGAPGALARPPNLLALVDRSKYEKHASPDRGHAPIKTSQKGQKQRSHGSSQISPAHQKWKPKNNEHRSGLAYTTRHWDHAPTSVEDDNEEPAWADEIVDYNDNFDFSQATLERDKDKYQAQQVATDISSQDLPSSGPQMSRFGFALEDTLDTDALSQMKQNVPAFPELTQPSSSQSSELGHVRHSRFKFPSCTEPVNSDLSVEFLQQSVSQARVQQKTVEFHGHHGHHSVNGFIRHEELTVDLPTQSKTQDMPSMGGHPSDLSFAAPTNATSKTLPSTIPKGKPVEVSQMFQMYAMANSISAVPPALPSAMVPNPHVANHVHLKTTSNQIPAFAGVQHPLNAMHSNLYSPVSSGPPPGLHSGVPASKPPSIPVRPLSIVGLNQPQHPERQTHQTPSTRSRPSPNERRRSKTDSGASSTRPKAAVPAAAAPPSYVRSYMNIQLPQQPATGGYYVPPGMATSPAQGFMGHHVPYPPPPPPAPYR